MPRLALVFFILALCITDCVSRLHHPKHKTSKYSQRRKTTQVFTLPTGFLYVSPTASTTAALTLKVGNRTINTNLQSALDDISPGVGGGKSIPDSATYPPNVYNSLYKSNPKSPESSSSSNTSSVIFEVLGIDPYSKEHRKFSMRFILMTSLYGTLGLSCILATYCLLRMIGGRQKRNRQYMLLTKRDLDFPLGGGGI